MLTINMTIIIANYVDIPPQIDVMCQQATIWNPNNDEKRTSWILWANQQLNLDKAHDEIVESVLVQVHEYNDNPPQFVLYVYGEQN